MFGLIAYREMLHRLDELSNEVILFRAQVAVNPYTDTDEAALLFWRQLEAIMKALDEAKRAVLDAAFDDGLLDWIGHDRQ